MTRRVPAMGRSVALSPESLTTPPARSQPPRCPHLDVDHVGLGLSRRRRRPRRSSEHALHANTEHQLSHLQRDVPFTFVTASMNSASNDGVAVLTVPSVRLDQQCSNDLDAVGAVLCARVKQSHPSGEVIEGQDRLGR